MQAIFAFCNKNGKSDRFSIYNDNFLANNKLFVNDGKFYCNGNFSGKYFCNGNVKMANNNEIIYIAFSNIFPDFRIISQCNQNTYIADIACKVRFTLLASVFIAQLCNFSSLRVDGLYMI